MRLWRGVQASGIAGLSATGAVLAHAGTSGLAETRWLAVALTGAVVAVAAIALALGLALALDRRAAVVHSGAPAPSLLAEAVDAPPFLALVAVMLACQGSAHAALLAAGVPATTGAVASPLLHAALAVAAAWIAWTVQRVVARSSAGLARALASILATCLRPPALRVGGDARRPRTRPGTGGLFGRAPPVSLASARVIASA
jgi:hypothetical protein